MIQSNLQSHSSWKPVLGSTVLVTRNRKLTNSILSDLVIDCNLPRSIVENKNFRHFLSVVDQKYTSVCLGL